MSYCVGPSPSDRRGVTHSSPLLVIRVILCGGLLNAVARLAHSVETLVVSKHSTAGIHFVTCLHFAGCEPRCVGFKGGSLGCIKFCQRCKRMKGLQERMDTGAALFLPLEVFGGC